MISVNVTNTVNYKWERTACKEYTVTNNTPSTVTFLVRELTGPMITNSSIQILSGQSVEVVLPRDGIYRVCNTANQNVDFYKFTFPGELVDGGFVMGIFEFVVSGTTYSIVTTIPVSSFADLETLADDMQTRIDGNGGTALVTAMNHGTYYEIIIRTLLPTNTTISNISYTIEGDDEFTIQNAVRITNSTVTFCDYLIELCEFEPCIEELLQRAICGCDELPCDPCDNKGKEMVAAQQQLDWLMTLVMMASMQSLKSNWASTGLSPYTEEPQSIVDGVELWNKIASFVLNCGKCPKPSVDPVKPCSCD